jgi:hypothetical protein
MIRRRRPVREISFSFDSFLDVVANVVGIIIRLILVVWVGARSYSSIQHLTARTTVHTPVATAAAALPEIKDPLQQELAQHRQALAEAQARLLEQLRQLQLVQEDRQLAEHDLAQAAVREQDLEQERTRLDQAAGEGGQKGQTLALSFDDLRQRREHLQDEIVALEKLPPLKKTLRYRTPVSQPVHAEEFLFECHHGRVSFIDIGSLVAEIRGHSEETVKLLRDQWGVTQVTDPVGAFRLRYTVERQRDTLEAVVPGAAPSPNGPFRARLREWVVEPVAEDRGESLTRALTDGSDFRRVVDGVDAQQSVVTFFVYPDSFGLYRQLRDWLYDRDVIVAGRPLPEGVPITFSPRGTVSRGQ